MSSWLINGFGIFRRALDVEIKTLINNCLYHCNFSGC